ncbi:SWIM zinc finger family protein [Streptomyces sp. NPDC059720]|uniref:SWIM zinc finger family protein n=1 Tax=Streptomyces sp. NPDC059720 TaxID=3346924 RepID=UPI0036979278
MTPRPADEARRALREARERTARERASAGPPDPTAPAPTPARQDPPLPGDAHTGGEAPRPGDSAREALRKAASATGQPPQDGVPGASEAPEQHDDLRGSVPDGGSRDDDDPVAGAADEPAQDDDAQDDDARDGAADERPQHRDDERARSVRGEEAPGRRSEPRAADVAREALRAARDDARRARQETEREGARRRRRARQRAVDARVAAVRRAGTDTTGAPTRDMRELLSDAFRMPDPDLPERPDSPHRADSEPAHRPHPDQPDRAGRELPEQLDQADRPDGEDRPARPDRRHRDLPDQGPRGVGPGLPDTPGEQGETSEPDDPSESVGPAVQDAAADTAPWAGDVSALGGTDPAPHPVDTAPGASDVSAVPETDPLPHPDDDQAPLAPPTAPAYARPRDPDSAEGLSRPESPESPESPDGPDGPDSPDSPVTWSTPAARRTSRAHRPGNRAAGRTTPEPPPTARAASAASPTPMSSGAAGAGSRRSMAAPNRDNDLRRTFPPFPPRQGESFAESWWGNAWVSALEQGALDSKRLERGRAYAEQGNVDAITVTPGLVLAYVQGSRPRPYRVQVRLRTLGDADWDRFLDAAADRAGHIAALLDKEMPRSLADCGVPLLPGPGDLEPQCSCPDRGHPCKHAAALCYQTARLLDADPFVLLLLRGRGERELLDALSRLSATRAARAAQDKEPAPAPGVRAGEVLAAGARPPLPPPLPVPPHPEQPPAYPASPGGPDPFALDQLATDAAARAHALLTTGRDPVGDLTFWQDAVRLAAARPGSGLTAGSRALYASLASAAGRSVADLARAVAAWRQGGPEGLAVLEEPWDPPAGRFDRARPLLLAADLPAFRPWRNHLTHPRGHLQLRLGRDGLWYAYESEPGREDWWPRGTPDLDPVGALTGLGAPGDA